MPQLQRAVRAARHLIPRGWSPLLRLLATALPPLRHYPARVRGGERLVLDLRESMCHGLFFEGAPPPHEEGVEAVLRRTLRPGSVFVDVGANLGYYTRIAARLVGAGGRVHAFEPTPSALRLLRANTADLPNATVHPLAVGEATGEVDFFVSRAGERSSLAPSTAATRVRSRMETLDRALAELPRLDLLKIDVEGFELGVLRGSRVLLARHRPAILFELLDEYAEHHGFGLQSYRELLEPLGYDLAWVRSDGTLAAEPEGEARDVLATPHP